MLPCERSGDVAPWLMESMPLKVWREFLRELRVTGGHASAGAASFIDGVGR